MSTIEVEIVEEVKALVQGRVNRVDIRIGSGGGQTHPDEQYDRE